MLGCPLFLLITEPFFLRVSPFFQDGVTPTALFQRGFVVFNTKSSFTTQWYPKMAAYNVVIPEAGFLRLHQIIGNPKADPPIPALIPVSRSTWWAGVKDGRFPKSVKLGPRTTAWRVEDIRALIEGAGS
jgi:predicted DNA-binding transcriptional regulator AlpA